MAPRLSRWIALTVIAAGIVATTLLTTGGAPILFLGPGGMRQDEVELTTVQRRIAVARSALTWVRAERARLEEAEQVAAVTARTNADPLVLKWEGTRLVLDAPATEAVGSVWTTLRARRSDVRTITLQNGRTETIGWWGRVGADLRPDGVCLIRTRSLRPLKGLVEDMRVGGGACFFAEQFGPPGKGVRAWLIDVRPGLSWDRTPPSYWFRGEADAEDQAVPAWFRGGGELSYMRVDMWREVNRLETACVTGRVERCVAATGVGDAGWPDIGEVRGFYFHQLPSARMTRDLLHAVGPEKFAEIWSSDSTIASSYARVTGAPMDGWLMQWGRHFMGTILQDNALSLGGWLGALIWIALLALLVTQRLKQRAAT